MKTLDTSKKITLATVKSFIKNNFENLLVKSESSFSGMSDMVEYDNNASFKPATKGDNNLPNTLGIEGTWFVGQSRDYFTHYNENGLYGIHVYNCCGSFTLAVRVNEEKKECKEVVMFINREESIAV